MKMRNIFSVTSKLQHRYLRLIELSLLLPTLLIGACFYYMVFTLIAEEIAIPEYVALMLFPALKRVNIILLIGVPIVFVLLWCWGLILSHRLAGPVERLTRELDEIVRGDYRKRLQVRKDDELKGVVGNINKLLEKIEGG
jgi:signal transduction histidine kinase